MKLSSKLLLHLFFLIYLAYSLFHYQERIIHLDAAFQYFCLVQEEWFYIPASRYGTIVIQLLPLLVLKVCSSLPVVLAITSVSTPLFSYLLFMVCVYRFKNLAAGATILIAAILCTTKTFYVANGEIFMAIPWVCLLFAYLMHNNNLQLKKGFGFYCSITLLLVTTFFTHPVSMFLSAFTIVYACLLLPKTSKLKIVLLLGITAIPALIKYFFTKHTGYEKEKITQLLQLPNSFNELIELPIPMFIHNFTFEINSMYLLPISLLAMVLVYYLFTKNYKKFIWVGLCLVAYLFFSSLAEIKGNSNQMLEYRLIPCAFIISLPLLNEVIFNYTYKIEAIGKVLVLCIIFIWKMTDITETGKEHTARLKYIEHVVNTARKHSSGKFIIERKKLNKTKLRGEWALGVETYLLSSIKTPNAPVTVYAYKSQNYDELYMEKGKLYLCYYSGTTWNMTNINKRFFKMPKGEYKEITETIN